MRVEFAGKSDFRQFVDKPVEQCRGHLAVVLDQPPVADGIRAISTTQIAGGADFNFDELEELRQCIAATVSLPWENIRYRIHRSVFLSPLHNNAARCVSNAAWPWRPAL